LENNLINRYEQVQARIRAALLSGHRPPGSVSLLAVSKRQSVAAIRELAGLGQRAFAENYLQEALGKMQTLADLPLEWHFIGHIQSNKTRELARHFHWVQSIDRYKIASRLNDQRPGELGPLNVCIQVNISNEASKSGITLEAVPELARAVHALPALTLRGLMAIPARLTSEANQRMVFARLRQLYESLRSAGLPLDTLSMGMSADLEAAIQEGATQVRIGTDLFGPRRA
jgi:pyridoxal phosphate enzyme (YggS family)